MKISPAVNNQQWRFKMNKLLLKATALSIALFGAIGVQTFTSCSGDDGSDGKNGTNGITPECKDGYWYNGDTKTEAACTATGTGINGTTPVCNETTGKWEGTTIQCVAITPVCNQTTGKWEGTDIQCVAETSIPPTCKDGFWHNGDVATTVPCTAGSTEAPTCTDGTWHNGTTDTGVSCTAGSAETPTCTDGTWHNGATDTGISCVGSGTDGVTPTCTNGTWHNGTTDTGISCVATGSDGTSCDVEEAGAYFVMKCGGVEKAKWAKAYCERKPYDPETSVCIGSQVWMSKNLNVAVEGSKCYNDDPANCDIYGRLYNWTMAKTACPAGWHLPTNDEWNELIDFVGETTSGTKLKANSDLWNAAGANAKGTDNYGFAALPSGYYNTSAFGTLVMGVFWSATDDGDNVNRLIINANAWVGWGDPITDKSSRFYSVRCIQD